jgi:hypothetical protein
MRLAAVGCGLAGAAFILAAPHAAFSSRFSGAGTGSEDSTDTGAEGAATEVLEPRVGRYHLVMGLAVACGVGFVFMGAFAWQNAGRPVATRRREPPEDGKMTSPPTRSGQWISGRQAARIESARKKS